VKLDFYGFATHVKHVAIRLSNRRFKAWELYVQRVKFLPRDVADCYEFTSDQM